MGTAFDSIVAAGVVVSGGVVENSVLSHDVFVGTGARVQDSVLMDKVTVGAGAVVRRAIVDKNVKIPAGATIGVDHDLDRARGFTITESGLTVLSKGQHVPAPDAHEREMALAAAAELPEAVALAAATNHVTQDTLDKLVENQISAIGVSTGGSVALGEAANIDG